MDSARVINLDQVPAADLVFRPPRRRVLFRLLYAVLAAAFAVTGWRLLHVGWLSGLVAIAGLVQLVGAVRAGTGMVTVGPDGLRIRFLVTTRTARWAEMTDCEVRAGTLGRSVRLTRTTPHRQWRLPAPASPYLIPDPRFDAEATVLRDLFTAHRADYAPAVTASGTGTPRRYRVGLAVLLAAALLLDQPWGWPSGPEATAVPNPCTAAGDHLIAMVDGYTAEHGSRRWEAGSGEWCSWSISDQRPYEFVTIQIRLYSRLGLRSGTWRAKAEFTRACREAAGVAVASAPRLGDESVLVESDVSAVVAGRRGNVLVWIVVRGPLSGYSRDEVLTVERDILDAVRLG